MAATLQADAAAAAAAAEQAPARPGRGGQSAGERVASRLARWRAEGRLEDDGAAAG
jgi:hypothetical protein